MHPQRLLCALLLLLSAFQALAAQDVEMLGRRYGTRPPQAFYDEMARNPDAFTFRRGRAARMRGEAVAPGIMLLRDGSAGPARSLGPRDGPVTGTFHIPVLLGLFSDSLLVPPFARGVVQTSYFSPSPGTITAYYDEVSGGRVSFQGDVLDWIQAPLTQAEVTQGQSALAPASLGGGGIGNFIYQLLSLQPARDWGLYDNDGPDGIPNSGDDDGFVDALAVIHPTRGAECSSTDRDNRIWSHKWSLGEALRGTVFVTPTAAAGGGSIAVDDYFVVGIVSCTSTALNEIGVFTHESGHAFGLPDLYDTDDSDGQHAGAGSWDLMGSGAWGCDDRTEETPCHMGAWSKSMLGWVDVVTVPPDVDLAALSVPPVETSGTVYRVDAGDGSGEYFLLENRQRLGFDVPLLAEGLLIWQIDPDWVSSRWASNVVNGAPHQGVWLRQADGRDDLGTRRSPRGDAGDPFPGASQNHVFHAASQPAATSYGGAVTGLTIVDITTVGDDLSLHLLTRNTMVGLQAQGTPGTSGLFTVDGIAVDPGLASYGAFPFETRTVAAASGDLIQPGVRTPFEAWSDDAAAPMVRALTTPLEDTTLVARYSGREVQLAVDLSGGIGGIGPGSLWTQPASVDRWFPLGTMVTLEARPLPGFGFLQWTGELLGLTNPTVLTMDAPLFGGADFELVYRVSSASFTVPAASVQAISLETVSGTAPVTWSLVSGTLPEGFHLGAEGRIVGAALETGSFPMTVRALDATGLAADGSIALDVRSPSIPIERAASFFLLVEPSLTPAEMMFLDRIGNGEAGYDLGDFRAWALGAPPLSRSLGAAPSRDVAQPAEPAVEPGGRR